jgi:hypothetical protein
MACLALFAPADRNFCASARPSESTRVAIAAEVTRPSSWGVSPRRIRHQEQGARGWHGGAVCHRSLQVSGPTRARRLAMTGFILKRALPPRSHDKPLRRGLCAPPFALADSTPPVSAPTFPVMLRVPPSPPRSGFIEPCLPSAAERPPSGPDWVHEIKHDGYRLMARRDPIGVRLLTRNGHDWKR